MEGSNTDEFETAKEEKKRELYLFLTGALDKTCIDCHKGIAHQLPDMTGVEGW